MSENIAASGISDVEITTESDESCQEFSVADRKFDYVDTEENSIHLTPEKTKEFQKPCPVSTSNENSHIHEDENTISNSLDVVDTDAVDIVSNINCNEREISKCNDDSAKPTQPDAVNIVSNINCNESEITKCNDDLARPTQPISSEKSSDLHKDPSNKQLSNLKKKRKKIVTALVNNDVEYLRKAAVEPAGLISDDIRQKVWPKLVGVDIFETSPRPSQEEIEEHPYYRQVVLDVNRSLKRFPPSIKENQRLAMQDQLVLLIMRVLVRHPELHYYQGYHDICVTFLLVLGEETAYYVVEQLSLSHLNVFMEKTMEPTIELLSYMYPLIGKKSSQLRNFLETSEVGVAYCLSWLITWFGHVLNSYDDVVRLFDFFIVSHAWMPVYLTAAVVLHRELEVMEQDCDMACVHSLLSKIPDDLPFEKLILQSQELYACYPPKLLQRENVYQSVSKLRGNRFVNSVVKTIKTSVPASKFTYSIVIAAAVLVTAVLYQAYKY